MLRWKMKGVKYWFYGLVYSTIKEANYGPLRWFWTILFTSSHTCLVKYFVLRWTCWSLDYFFPSLCYMYHKDYFDKWLKTIFGKNNWIDATFDVYLFVYFSSCSVIMRKVTLLVPSQLFLTLSPLQTALGQSKTMNGRVHWSYLVLKGLQTTECGCGRECLTSVSESLDIVI